MTDTFVPDAAIAGPAYTTLRLELGRLLRSGEPDVGERRTPACPDWTVADVVAHLCGVCEDILALEMEGVASDAWTEKHVERHRGEPLVQVLDRWDATGEQVEQITAMFPNAQVAAQFVFDAVTHSFDIRGALGDTGARELDAITIGASFLLEAIDAFIVGASLPPLSVALDGLHHELLGLEAGSLVIGAGSPSPTAPIELRTSAYELLRGFGGRRSLEQLRALDWSEDPTPYFCMFDGSPLRPPAEPLIE